MVLDKNNFSYSEQKCIVLNNNFGIFSIIKSSVQRRQGELLAAAALYGLALLSQSLQKIKDTVGFQPLHCTKIARPIVQCIDSFLMSIDADFTSKAKLRWQSESRVQYIVSQNCIFSFGN